MTGNESICVKCREHMDVNQPYLQPFKKILTVNTGMVMVNYKKYGMNLYEYRRSLGNGKIKSLFYFL